MGEAVLEEQGLPLPHHAQVAVVQNGDLHGQLLDDGGGHLLDVHLDAAIARDVPHDVLGTRHLGSDGGGKAEKTRFLDEGLRLRTACDLMVKEDLKAQARAATRVVPHRREDQDQARGQGRDG